MQGRRRVRIRRTHLPQLLLEGILLLAALGLLLGRWPAGVRTGVGDDPLIDGFDILSPRLAPGHPRDLEHTRRGTHHADQSPTSPRPLIVAVKRKNISPFFLHQKLTVRTVPLISSNWKTSVETVFCSLYNRFPSVNCRSRYIPELCRVDRPQGNAKVNQATWLHITYLANWPRCPSSSIIRWTPCAGSTSAILPRSWIYIVKGRALFSSTSGTFDPVSFKRFSIA